MKLPDFKALGLKKLIIFGTIALVLLGGLGVGGVILKKKIAARRAAKLAAANDPQKLAAEKAAAEAAAAKANSEEDEDEPAGAEGGGHEGAAGGPAVMIYQKIVNLDRKNAYLKVEMHILFRDPELGKAATSEKPTPEASEIRAMLLELLSGKTLEEASDIETREFVRKEIKDKLNEKFAPKPPKPGEKVDPKHKKPKKPIKDVLVVDWAISA
ncbi:MAG: flagellar basal body-associated FliL family protein [Holophaga sp.]